MAELRAHTKPSYRRVNLARRFSHWFVWFFFFSGKWEVFLLDFIPLVPDGWVGLKATSRLEFILNYLA